MPAQVTTRAQVNGYRFLIRRLEHALIRGDSRMIHDPMRGQMRALLVGVVIAVLIAGAAGVLAFFKPSPNFGNAQILLSKSNGSAFVRIGERLHPVLNLASARLITGANESPKQVDDKFLNTVPLGPTVGIIGAPSSIHRGDDMATSSWTVCDTTQTPAVTEATGSQSLRTTVVANDPVLDADIREAAAAQTVLTQVGDKYFLIYNGVRAQLDPTDPVLFSALRLEEAEVRTLSPGLLDAFPLVDPIVPVTIAGIGEKTSYLEPRYRVGSIVSAVDSDGEQLYVVLRDGLQPISPATADIIRYGDIEATGDQSNVPPGLVSAAPISTALHVDHYPTAVPEYISTEPDRVICLSWQRGASAAEATNRLLVGHRLPIPTSAKPVELATADGNGPGLDSVYLKPGTGEYVQATGIEPDSRAMGQLFYVSDTGLRFHVKDLASASALGLVGVAAPGSNEEMPLLAPWPVLSLLPPGPELSQAAALIAHDGMAADPDGTQVEPPT